jgi:integrase
MLVASLTDRRERWAIFLGICAGIRNAEMRGLQGRHFERESGRFIWISPDIGKGKRERYIPVMADLALVVGEIRERVGPDEYVLPAQRFRDPGLNRFKADKRKHPSSPQALFYLVRNVASRCGLPLGSRNPTVAGVGPHTLRHAFAEHVARTVGLEEARMALGHADLATTEAYLSKVMPLDDLARAFEGASFGLLPDANDQSDGEPSKAVEAPTGIEPVGSPIRSVEPFLAAWLRRTHWIRTEAPKVRRFGSSARTTKQETP